jgi:hypothetical protein
VTASVPIPTYQDAHLLRKSLPLLLARPSDEIEVVILNNNRAQDVRGAIGELADDPRVRIVEMGFEDVEAEVVPRMSLGEAPQAGGATR